MTILPPSPLSLAAIAMPQADAIITRRICLGLAEEILSSPDLPALAAHLESEGRLRIHPILPDIAPGVRITLMGRSICAGKVQDGLTLWATSMQVGT